MNFQKTRPKGGLFSKGPFLKSYAGIIYCALDNRLYTVIGVVSNLTAGSPAGASAVVVTGLMV